MMRIYLPSIMSIIMPRALEEFTHQHYHHRLRTEHNFTPQKLYWNKYGVDTEGPSSDAEVDNCVIVVPPHVIVSNVTTSQPTFR